MKLFVLFLVTASLCLLSFAQNQETPAADTRSQDSRVYREPFTLRIRVDASHYYEERYEKRIPYVADNDVYLFSAENFGVKLTPKGEGVELAYERDPAKADVLFTFEQPKQLGAGMMLTIQNRLKQKLEMDALMTVPGKQGIFKTSIVPIEAGLSDFESWPHPIVQLVLRNFRLSDSQKTKH